MKKSEKERIVQLFDELRNRSGLSVTRILARVQSYGVDLSRDAFNNRFVRLDRMVEIEPELILAIIQTFTRELPNHERCTAEEALELADLARLSLSRLDELARYFPEDEFTKTNGRQRRTVRYDEIEEQKPQSIVESSYKDYLMQEYGNLPLGGIAPRIQNRHLNFSVDDLYIPARLEQEAPLQTTFVMSGVKGFEALRTTDPRIVGFEALHAYQRVVVLGEPGSGKSTLLRWYVTNILKGANPSADGILPIFIRLIHFGTVLVSRPEIGLAQYIQEYHRPEFSTLFNEILKGRGILLLDGLDEVADLSIRRLVRDALQVFAAQFSNIQIVVSSRIVGYRSVQFFGDFKHFTLQPFGIDEISQFIYNWHFAVSRQDKSVPASREQLEARVGRFIEDIQVKPQIRQMAGTPLLLAIIVLMDWRNKKIPHRRVELYREAIRTLLEDWPMEHQRSFANGFDFDTKIEILARLSLFMFESGLSYSIGEEQLESQLAQVLTQMEICNEYDAMPMVRKWLTFLSEQSGLLLKAGTDDFSRPVYSFLHLSFVEYLCGHRIGRLWKEQKANLSDYINRPKWREAILLMIGEIGIYSREDASQLIGEIYSAQPPHHDVLHQPIVLAAACLADDIQITTSMRAIILDELITLWHRRVTGLLRSKLFRILAAMRGTEYAYELILLLKPLLHDHQEWVRSGVLELLGKLGSPSDPEVKQYLVAALDDQSTEVQYAAIRSMESLQLAMNPSIRLRLIELLKEHGESRIRVRSAIALRCVVERDVTLNEILLQSLKQDYDNEVRRIIARVFSVVRQPEPTLLEQMFIALSNGSGGVDKEAATTFLTWGDAGQAFLIRALAQALNNSNDDVKKGLIQTIVSVQLALGGAGVDLLLSVVETERSSEIRAVALRALGDWEIADERVLQLLLRLSTDENRLIRHHAIIGLKKRFVQNREAIYALVQALGDPYVAVRQHAAQALASCGIKDDDSIIHALESALTDEEERVRLYAAISLIKLDAYSPKSYELLHQAFRSTNGDIRVRAVLESRQIIHHLEPQLIATQIELVRDDNREVREQAVRTLGELGPTADKHVQFVIQQALKDEYHQVRAYAAESLAKLGKIDEQIIDSLVFGLLDAQARVRLAASSTLVALGEGDTYDYIVIQVRNLLENGSPPDDVLNTLWGLVVGD